jgi:23S rRNA pseudouridine2605 synthase
MEPKSKGRPAKQKTSRTAKPEAKSSKTAKTPAKTPKTRAKASTKTPAKTAKPEAKRAEPEEGAIRLHVLLARAGVASRREAERLIAAGEVVVNGRTVTEPGAHAREGVDHVRVSGRLIHGAQKLRHFMYHKPVGCVSTLKDPEGRFCIGDVVDALGVRGLHPVGRLDYHSSGLLILTNDGELTEGLTHPRYHVEKRYAAKVSPRPSRDAVDALRGGVNIRGVRTAPAFVREVRHASDKSWFDVRIAEGRNQQVRRMFEAVGSHVEKLRREAVGPLMLGDLEPGDARPLTAAEVRVLREAIHAAQQPEPRRTRRDPRAADVARAGHPAPRRSDPRGAKPRGAKPRSAGPGSTKPRGTKPAGANSRSAGPRSRSR